jgi:hypothetical protein
VIPTSRSYKQDEENGEIGHFQPDLDFEDGKSVLELLVEAQVKDQNQLSPKLLEEIETHITHDNSARNMVCSHFFRAVHIDAAPENALLAQLWT